MLIGFILLFLRKDRFLIWKDLLMFVLLKPIYGILGMMLLIFILPFTIPYSLNHLRKDKDDYDSK
jgi:hypothetical protein